MDNLFKDISKICEKYDFIDEAEFFIINVYRQSVVTINEINASQELAYNSQVLSERQKMILNQHNINMEKFLAFNQEVRQIKVPEIASSYYIIKYERELE